MEVLNDREETEPPPLFRAIFCFGSAHAPCSFIHEGGFMNRLYYSFISIYAADGFLCSIYMVEYIQQAMYC